MEAQFLIIHLKRENALYAKGPQDIICSNFCCLRMFFKKNFEYIQQCFYIHTDNFVLLLYFVFFVKSMTIYVLT